MDLKEAEDIKKRQRESIQKRLKNYTEKIDRKAIKEIAKNVDEKWLQAIECVRLAPSYKDTQPWRFYGDINSLNIYRKRVGEESTSKIDMGIALRHFDIGCKYHGIEFEYIKMNSKKKLRMDYYISIK